MAPSAISAAQVEDFKSNTAKKPVERAAGYGAELDSDDIAQKTGRRFPKPPKFTSKLQEREWIKFRLAQAFRIFAHLEYDDGIAGHITVRDPIKPNCFWVNPFGVHFSLIQPEDLLLVDQDGNVLEESGPNKLLNRAAFMIHSAIHVARPDVNCAAHSHSIYGKAFSTLGVPLDMITQDSCAFYNDHAVYTDFNGVVLEADEGRSISKALGDKKAIILRNHGLLVVTPSIESTVFFFIALEKSCRVQLLADAAAAGRADGKRTVKISHESATFTHQTIGTLRGGWFNGLPQFAALEAREGIKFDFGKEYE